MRLLSIVIAAVVALIIFDLTEVDAASVYAASPFDRCIEAFEGTARAAQCYTLNNLEK